MKKLTSNGMKKVIIAALAFAPVLVSAQGNLNNLTSLVNAFGNIVKSSIPIVFGILVIVFFFGLARFVFSAGNEESKATGKKIMLWGLVALFIAASVWGLVTFIRGALGVDNQTTITVPTLQ